MSKENHKSPLKHFPWMKNSCNTISCRTFFEGHNFKKLQYVLLTFSTANLTTGLNSLASGIKLNPLLLWTVRLMLQDWIQYFEQLGYNNKSSAVASCSTELHLRHLKNSLTWGIGLNRLHEYYIELLQNDWIHYTPE